MNIKIISDSTCDLSKELLGQYNISITPLYVVKNADSFKDGIDITPTDIFNHVDNGGDLCKTSAVSQADYEEIFSRYAKDFDAVIQITIGCGFSSCYQNACNAAKSFSNVYVIDSANLSTGQGLVVMAAAKMAEKGMPIDDIVKELNILTTKVEASFIVERLDYLHKGGRCSTIAALGANLLNLKPCIEVKDGKMSVGKKYRGNFEKCLKQYVKERLEGRDDLRKDLIFITHPAVSEKIVNMVKENISLYTKFDEIIPTKAGCTIACHCGPNTLGVLFVRK